MVLDCRMYQRTLKSCNFFIEQKKAKGKNPSDIASDLCFHTGAPIAVCVVWLMRPEWFGQHAGLQSTLDKLKKFYNYKDVIQFD